MTDSQRLEEAIRRQHSSVDDYKFADEIAKSIGIGYKQCLAILNKWSRTGKWECGVSSRSGWFKDGIGAYHGYNEKRMAGG